MLEKEKKSGFSSLLCSLYECKSSKDNQPNFVRNLLNSINFTYYNISADSTCTNLFKGRTLNKKELIEVSKDNINNAYLFLSTNLNSRKVITYDWGITGQLNFKKFCLAVARLLGEYVSKLEETITDSLESIYCSIESFADENQPTIELIDSDEKVKNDSINKSCNRFIQINDNGRYIENIEIAYFGRKEDDD